MIRKATMTALILVVLIIWTILGKVVSGALGKWEQRAVQALKKQKISRKEEGNNKKANMFSPLDLHESSKQTNGTMWPGLYGVHSQ